MTIKKLAIQTSTYSIGSLLVTIGGLISFPILTRILSVEEYGLLNLISSTLLFIVAIAKLGFQKSIVRFQSEAFAGNLACSLTQFYSLVIISMVCVGALASALWLLLVMIAPASWFNHSELRFLFSITAILIFIRVSESAIINIFRSEQRTILYNVFVVTKRYLGIGTILFFLFFISKDLTGFYLATILVEASLVIVIFYIFVQKNRISINGISIPLYKEMLLYGLPMVGYELGSIVLNIGDRYVIQGLMGSEALGAYSAAYNLCEYVQAVLVTAVGAAIMPIYMRIWATSGEQATKDFLHQSMYYYLLIGLPLGAGFSAVGGEFLALLASEKYLGGASSIPYIISGMLIDGAMVIFAAGLYIHKRTLSMMILFVGVSAVNIGLNFLLIPRFGIEGAAMATLISYLILAVLAMGFSYTLIRIKVPTIAFVKFGLVSLGMYLVLGTFQFENLLVEIGIKVSLGALFYGSFVLILEPRLRLELKGLLNTMQSHIDNLKAN